MRLCLFVLFLCTCAPALFAQSVSGRVTNEFGEPVPFANVLIQELGTGTTTDDEGRYVLRPQTEGSYRLIFSSLGYSSTKHEVILTLEETTLDVVLRTSDVQLNEIVVNADKRDPAYAIIREVVKRKADHLRAADSYRTNIYVKATEVVDRKQNKPPPPPDEEEEVVVDPFAAEEKARKALLAKLNMVEMAVTLNFQQPRSYKEERTAYQAYGNVRGLFIPKFGETDFNFYRNLVPLTGISDAPVISPLSNTGVLSYKFRLESTDLEGDQIVYKIRVTPRKQGNSTCRGTLWINGDSYTINRLDLTFSKYPLRFFDDFRLEQTYTQTDDRWIVDRQVFHYVARQGKKVTFNGTTTLRYADYEHNYPFPPKFFGNEVAVTTREAYERDTTYWRNSRTVALTEEEARMVAIQDSVTAVRTSRAYQDSLQELYNKIKPLELLWDGIGFRNNRKKSHLYIAPLPALINFSVVGGFRVGPYVSYTRRYADGQYLRTSGNFSYGFLNNDLTGSLSVSHLYDPFSLSNITVDVERDFESIFPNDAYLNQLRASNYILRNRQRIGHQVEVLNGLFLRNGVEYVQRKPITGLNTSSFLSGLVDDETEPLAFEPYEAFITRTSLSYTPGLKYMREPDRKIRLGSRWPTFTALYRRGWSGPLSSDIDFTYVEGKVDQNLRFGVLGNSNYELKVGKFTNTRDLRVVDIKRFRQADPILMSDPSQTFNALDTSLNTTNLFVEFHHIHHFNGALINNVPLLKKTRIKTLVGAGFLYLPAEDYRYQEVFVGLERVFKIGARRRLRLGTYAVLGDATDGRATTSFKVSFDVIDLWKRDWDF